MFLKQIFLGACGLGFGFLASAGVFTVLVSVGLIPRFAGKMHVAKKVFALEEAVVLGTLCGGFLSVFSEYGNIGGFVLSRSLFGAGTALGGSRRVFCRNVCGVPCPCHCGNAGLYSDFFKKDRLPAWAGNRHCGGGLRKGGREPSLLCKGDLYVRDVIGGLCSR